jgi:hypothetical protein
VSSNYIYTPGGKLGQISSPYGPSGPLNPGSYMSTQAPSIAPILQASGYKPIGTAITEGLETGTKLGQSIQEAPSEIALKKAQVAQLQTSTQIAQNEANIAALQAGLQVRGGFGATTGQQTNVPLPFPDLWNKGGTKVQPNTSSTNTGGTNTGTTGGTNNQTASTNQTPPAPVQQNTAQTGNTEGTPIATGSGTTEIPSGSGAATPSPTIGQVALATANARAQYLQENPNADTNSLSNSPVGTPNPATQQGFDPNHLQVTPDGRKLTGYAPNGTPVYWDDQRQDAYTYEPVAGGKEQRFYSRYTNPEEWQKGVTMDNVQEKQEEQMRQYLNEHQFNPEHAGYPKGTTVSNLKGMDLVNASETAHIINAKMPLDKDTEDDLQRRGALIDAGQNVENALNAMRDKNGNLDPGQYNVVKTTLADLGGKYATVPIVGDVLKKLNGGQGPTQQQSNLFQAYNTYLEAARQATTGNMRANPQEFTALEKSLGSPQETNWDFAQRFGTNLNQQRLNYIDRVDQRLAAGTKFQEMGPSGEVIGTPSPILNRADQLRPMVRNYAASLKPTPVIQGNSSTGGNAPAQQKAAPTEITNTADLAKVRDNGMFTFKGHTMQATPELKKKLLGAQ